MSILVTGGCGYIGSHTVVELLNNNKEVVIVDDYSNSKPEVLNRIETITGKRPRFYHVNILDEEKLSEVFEKESIDSVIHFAAFKAVGESVNKPLDYYQNNLQGLLTVLKVMSKFNVKIIVFSSSATVYGMHNQSPLKEDLPTSATNPYGYTKLMNEQILLDCGHADHRMSVALLRYFNPIGAHESGLIGEDPEGIPNNLMPYITQVAKGKLDKLKVFGNDYPTVDGTGVRDYIHVVDLAEGHVAALDKLTAGVHIYNLGTGQGTSVLQLLKAFEEANGLKVPYEIVDRRPGDIAECYANASKAERELGWKAKRDIIDMCRDAWRFEKNNGG